MYLGDGIFDKLQNDETEFVHITKDNIIPSSLIASFAVKQQAENEEVDVAADNDKMISAEYLTQEQIEKLDYDTKLVNKFLDNPNSLTADEEKYFQEEVNKAQSVVKFGTAGHRELIINENGEETFNPFVVYVLTDAYAQYINNLHYAQNK